MGRNAGFLSSIETRIRKMQNPIITHTQKVVKTEETKVKIHKGLFVCFTWACERGIYIHTYAKGK